MAFVANATAEINAQSQYKIIITICLVMTSLSVVIGTRLVFAGVYSVLCIIRTYHSITETKYGLGLPLALRPPQNIVTYLEVNYAGRPIYQISISFFKIALLIGYLRLLQGTSNKAYRGAIWCTIAFVSVSHVGSAMSFVALRLSADREVVETR
ncbi:hypothetical protein MY8738_006315 [Beauveria namnaoensis]